MDKPTFINLLSQTESGLKKIQSIAYVEASPVYVELVSLFNDFRQGGLQLLENSEVLQLGIVGQVNVGKSSFLNSLFFNGENVLPKASTPMTAGLTILEYSEENVFEVEYFTAEDWEIFVQQHEAYVRMETECRQHMPDASDFDIRKEIEKRADEKIIAAHEMVSTCSARAFGKIGTETDTVPFAGLADLQAILEQYVGANGEYTPVVKSLYIRMQDERLKGLRIVDTPGINDPVISRENRTRQFLHASHGVFLLSAASEFLSSVDVNFLNGRIGSQGIGCVLLLACKFDSVLQDAAAEREMKGEGREDLAGAVDRLMKKMKRRLKEQKEAIDPKIRIKLDYVSGIGYSIAHKASSEWDEMERNVVKQMKHFYPDYFATEADTKVTCEGLSNMADIQEKYLQGWFMVNKEEIIQKKIDAYFVQNKKGIVSALDKRAGALNLKKDQLNQMTQVELNRQRTLQSRLFENLSHKFKNVFGSFQNSLQSDLVTMQNTIRLESIYNIPTEKTSNRIEYRGWLWGHNSDTFPYEVVDTSHLHALLTGQIQDYVKKLNEEWKKMFEKARLRMRDELCTAITDFEAAVVSASFNDTYYRQLLDDTLDKMRLKKELDVADILKETEWEIVEICNKQYVPPYSSLRECEKKEIPDMLAAGLRAYLREVRTSIHILQQVLIDKLKKEIVASMKQISTEIEELKTNFTTHLAAEGKAYLDQLETEMAKKMEVLHQLEELVKTIGEMRRLYK